MLEDLLYFLSFHVFRSCEPAIGVTREETKEMYSYKSSDFFSQEVPSCYITSRLYFIRERSLGSRGPITSTPRVHYLPLQMGRPWAPLIFIFWSCGVGWKHWPRVPASFSCSRLKWVKEKGDLGVVVLACDLSTWRLRQEEGKFIAQPGLQSETLCLYDSKYQIKWMDKLISGICT